MTNTKPTTGRQSEQTTTDWKAGSITTDETIGRLIAANCEWAARFMSPQRVEQLALLLQTLADTDPVLLELSGRDSPTDVRANVAAARGGHPAYAAALLCRRRLHQH